MDIVCLVKSVVTDTAMLFVWKIIAMFSNVRKGTPKFATTLVIMVSVNLQHIVAINIYREKILRILKRSKRVCGGKIYWGSNIFGVK